MAVFALALRNANSGSSVEVPCLSTLLWLLVLKARCDGVKEERETRPLVLAMEVDGLETDFEQAVHTNLADTVRGKDMLKEEADA